MRTAALFALISALVLSAVPMQWKVVSGGEKQTVYGVLFPALTTRAGSTGPSLSLHWLGIVGNGLAGGVLGLVLGAQLRRRERSSVEH